MEVTSRAQRAKSLPCQEKTLQPSRTAMATPIRIPLQKARDPRSRSLSPTAHSARKGGRGMGILEKCSPGATRFEGRRRNRTISCDDPNLLTSCPNSSSTAMPPLPFLILLISPQLQFPPLFLSGRASVGWTFRNVESVNREEGREKVSIHVPQPPPQIRNPLLL